MLIFAIIAHTYLHTMFLVLPTLAVLWYVVASKNVQAFAPELAYVTQSLNEWNTCRHAGRSVWRRLYDRYVF